ncbi:MAG: hypothetical protein K2X46_05610, partial [Roseomonas sp.]|nr:hypothetical protein [Roseomonas sp.]MBX9698643.1 hypothetical protein [Acetobacteraceae bacterium]
MPQTDREIPEAQGRADIVRQRLTRSFARTLGCHAAALTPAAILNDRWYSFLCPQTPGGRFAALARRTCGGGHSGRGNAATGQLPW